MENDTTTRKQYQYKILVIGDPGTGKSSIVRQFVHHKFTANYRPTIGVDFAMKSMSIDEDKVVHLQMWDISGQDRYGVMTRVYYKDAHAALIVLDSTRDRTYDGALKWKSDLDKKVTLADGSPVPAVLVANKCDLNSDLTDEKLAELEEENGFIGAYRVSAKDNIGIEDAFMRLVSSVLTTEQCGHYEMPFMNRDGRVRLGEDSNPRETRDGKCC